MDIRVGPEVLKSEYTLALGALRVGSGRAGSRRRIAPVVSLCPGIGGRWV